jgi:DNA-directed RNA polymerase subunit RPC12/RpoP
MTDNNENISTIYQYFCPRCGKRRLFKAKPWSFSKEKIKNALPNGNFVEHEPFENLCHVCQKKLFLQHYQPTEKDVEKVMEAIKQGHDLGDKSIEELL